MARRRSGRPSRVSGWSRFWRAVARGWRWGFRRQTSEYARFMLSREWAVQRARALRRDGWRCRDCATARAQEVHHQWYGVPLAATPDEALVSLCEPCHRRRHRPRGGGTGPTSRRLW
jgi:5-methylcytosine-specific restriction protein A